MPCCRGILSLNASLKPGTVYLGILRGYMDQIITVGNCPNYTPLLGIESQTHIWRCVQNPQKGTFTMPWITWEGSNLYIGNNSGKLTQLYWTSPFWMIGTSTNYMGHIISSYKLPEAAEHWGSPRYLQIYSLRVRMLSGSTCSTEKTLKKTTTSEQPSISVKNIFVLIYCGKSSHKPCSICPHHDLYLVQTINIWVVYQLIGLRKKITGTSHISSENPWFTISFPTWCARCKEFVLSYACLTPICPMHRIPTDFWRSHC